MKRYIPVMLLGPIPLLLSAVGGDPTGTSVLIYGTSVLLFISGLVLLPTAKGNLMRYGAVYGGVIGLSVLIAQTHFPFRATFKISEAALRRLAVRIQAGETVSLPKRAGLFTIRQAGQKYDGSIYLWVDPDPSGPEGFVYRYAGKGYNLWSELKFDDDWYYICED